MESLEDYDEFGNYIGADLESDDEEDNLLQEGFVRRPQVGEQPLEGFIEEPGPDAQALMEVDGTNFGCWIAAPGMKTNSLRTYPQRRRPPRGQKVLSDRRRNLWARCRDTCSGGRCSAAVRTHYCTSESEKMGSRGEGSSGDAF